MVVVLLRSSHTDVELDRDSDGWCTVTLAKGDERVVLGADRFTVVVARLLEALEEGCGETPNGQPKWILSLMERHCSVYLECLTSCIDLLIQGANGQLLERISLSTDETQQWLEVLREAINIQRS